MNSDKDNVAEILIQAKSHISSNLNGFFPRVQCKVLLITNTNIYRNARRRSDGITGGACPKTTRLILQLFKVSSERRLFSKMNFVT